MQDASFDADASGRSGCAVWRISSSATRARRLNDALARAGRDSWVDWEGTPPTAEWLSEIRAAIEAADAFVFVVSRASIASHVCRLEFEHAEKFGKRLIPVACEDLPDGTAFPALARLHSVGLRPRDDFDAGVRQLIRAFDIDLDWVKGHTRLLLRASEWRNKHLDPSLLLRGSDLAAAEKWLGGGIRHRDPQPVADQVEYINASRKAAAAATRLVPRRAIGKPLKHTANRDGAASSCRTP